MDTTYAVDVSDKWGEKMSRYIDITTINPRTYESSEVELGVLAYDYDEIQAMPFLDIVRCKDCKFWNPWHCSQFNDHTHEVDYCSYGERKETDHE